MKPFNMKLSDEDRAKLEAHRAKLGLRSHADVVRHWINAGDAARAAEPARRYGEPSARAIAAAKAAPPGSVVPFDGETGDPIGISPEQAEMIRRGELKVQVGPFTPIPGSRLKPDKGGKK